MTPMRGVKCFPITLIMRPNNSNDGAQSFPIIPIMRPNDTNDGVQGFPMIPIMTGHNSQGCCLKMYIYIFFPMKKNDNFTQQSV